jgi:uncharacterized protein YciI
MPFVGNVDRLRYIYRIKPTRPAMLTDGPTAAEADVISRHFDYLQRLTEAGVMILVGRTLTTDDETFGVAIFEASSEAEARQVLADDPAVREGVMQGALFPFRIALVRTAEADP